LLAWARVLLAALMLREHGRSVVNVARGAGYATDHALRRAMRDLAQADPASVPRNELLDLASDGFRRELRGLREKVRERRRDTHPGRGDPSFGE
jgi:hypothetical protein